MAVVGYSRGHSLATARQQDCGRRSNAAVPAFGMRICCKALWNVIQVINHPQFIQDRMRLEHFNKSCSAELKKENSGLFGFWLPPSPRLPRTARFGSVRGGFKPAPSLRHRQKPKILAAHRNIFSVDAPVFVKIYFHIASCWLRSLRLLDKAAGQI